MKIARDKKRTIIMVVLFSFIAAFPLHAAYEFLGKQEIVGWFAPVNESIWEHLKLAFYPLVLFLLLPITEYQRSVSWELRLQQAAGATIISMLVIVFGYYGLKGGFGVSGLVTDILLLLIGNLAGVWYQVWNRTRDRYHPEENGWKTVLAVIYLMVMTVLFVRFTVQPLGLPMFQDVGK